MTADLADFAEDVEAYLRRCLIVHVLLNANDGPLTPGEIWGRIRALTPEQAAQAVREVSAQPGMARLRRLTV